MERATAIALKIPRRTTPPPPTRLRRRSEICHEILERGPIRGSMTDSAGKQGHFFAIRAPRKETFGP